MGAQILDLACTIQCPHGGRASAISVNQKVKVGGTFALLVSDIFVISGCPFKLPSGNPQPCLTINWLAPAGRDNINQTPVLLTSSVGLCMNAQNAPQGTAIVSGNQTKVNGQ